ncbi:major facilitator superfamily domain-containing protein [Phycomyces nitens]|nr:major facilitator superfamily domain-containing protein [Phycomyces nitens]
MESDARVDINTVNTLLSSEKSFPRSLSEPINQSAYTSTALLNGPPVEQPVVVVVVGAEPVFGLRTYPQAWVALACLVFLRVAIALFQYTYCIVPSLISEFFGVSLTAVNWLANVQCIVYVFVSFFTGLLFEKLGLKRSIILAGFLNALGAGIRCIGANTEPPSFGLTLAGQLLGSIANPLTLNIMTMFASSWFTDRLRTTAGMLVASNYGAIIGMFLIPSMTVSTDQVPRLIYVVGLVSLGALFPVMAMPAKPPTPPSHIQDLQRPKFVDGLRLLARNYNFWILFLIQGLNVGLCIAFGTLLTQIISPYGYSAIEAGQLNAVGFLAGILGCSIAGPLLDATKQHKLFLRLVAPMILVADTGLLFASKYSIPNGSYATIMIIMCVSQFFLCFLVPVVIDLGSETAYPVAESTTSSILWQGAQLFGFLFVIVMDSLRGPANLAPETVNNTLLLQAVVAGLISVLSFAYRGQMARTEAIRREEKAASKPKPKSSTGISAGSSSFVLQKDSILVF